MISWPWATAQTARIKIKRLIQQRIPSLLHLHFIIRHRLRERLDSLS
jgi:hypothetical protein